MDVIKKLTIKLNINKKMINFRLNCDIFIMSFNIYKIIEIKNIIYITNLKISNDETLVFKIIFLFSYFL